MANIRIDLESKPLDGQTLTIKAPCDCSAITGFIIYYPGETEGETTSTVFTMKDAHGNSLNGVNNLFESGAYISLLLDTTNNYVYLKNADTNKYLETQLGYLNAYVAACEKNPIIKYKQLSARPSVAAGATVFESMGEVRGDNIPTNYAYFGILPGGNGYPQEIMVTFTESGGICYAQIHNYGSATRTVTVSAKAIYVHEASVPSI